MCAREGSDTGKGGKLIYIFLEYFGVGQCSGNDLLMVGGCLYLFWENAMSTYLCCVNDLIMPFKRSILGMVTF